MSGESAACPEWCARQHAPSWPIHRGEVTGVVLSSALVVEISTVQYGDRPAAVSVDVFDDQTDSMLVIDLDATTAGELVSALGASLADVYGRGWRP